MPQENSLFKPTAFPELSRSRVSAMLYHRSLSLVTHEEDIPMLLGINHSRTVRAGSELPELLAIINGSVHLWYIPAAANSSQGTIKLSFPFSETPSLKGYTFASTRIEDLS